MSNTPSIPDRAALVVAGYAETNRALDELRSLEGNWTGHKLLAEEAMDIAARGLQQTSALLHRVRALVDAEVKRLKDEQL